MHGYDTLQGAWNETDRDWDALPWQSVQITTSGVVKRTLNRPLVQLTRIEALEPATGAIRQMGTTFQCSLPKVLYGNNVQELPPSDVPAALDALHQLLQEDIPGCPHPSLTTPRRIDATDNRMLGSEKQVRAALRACRAFNLGRTKPYIGQEGTVNWPGKSGGHRSKVYSKYRDLLRPGREADEDLCVQAEGVLRVESGAIGLKSIRADFAKALALAEARGDLTVGTALGCPGLAEAILAPLNGIVDTVLGSEFMHMKLDETIEKMRAGGKTYHRAMGLIGFAHAIQEFGWQGLMLTRQGIYDLKKEFAALGIDPQEIELGPLMMRITKPYQAGDKERAQLAKQQAKEDAAGDGLLRLTVASDPS
jgi:hypothetical protein